jgi:hypothetical protein
MSKYESGGAALTHGDETGRRWSAVSKYWNAGRFPRVSWPRYAVSKEHPNGQIELGRGDRLPRSGANGRQMQRRMHLGNPHGSVRGAFCLSGHVGYHHPWPHSHGPCLQIDCLDRRHKCARSTLPQETPGSRLLRRQVAQLRSVAKVVVQMLAGRMATLSP